MIRKIDIDSFGPYNGYTWHKNIPEAEYLFKSINIFYGRNYAGKTTLSRIFGSLEKKELPNEYENSKFTVKMDDNTSFTEDNLNDFPYILKVYNSDFVKENLSFFNNDMNDIRAFAVIGEENIQIQNQIDLLKEELGLYEHSIGIKQDVEESLNIFKEYDDAQIKLIKDIQDSLRNKAREIKNNAKIYNQPTYNISSIQKDIDYIFDQEESNVNSIDYSEDNLDNLTKIINEQPKSTPTFNFSYAYEKIINLYNETNDLISRTIKPTQQLNNLINDALLQEWVRQGKEIHSERHVNTCLFCHSPISNNLWSKLSDHFNKDSEELREKLLNIQKELKIIRGSHQNVSLPPKDLFYIDLQDFWVSISNSFYKYNNQIIEVLDSMLEAIDNKLMDIFNPLEQIPLTENLFHDYLSIVNAMKKTLKEHTDKTSNLKAIQDVARKELLYKDLKKYITESEYINKIGKLKILEDSTKAKKVIWQQKKGLFDTKKKALEELEKSLVDISLAATKINSLLYKHFGHNNLELKTISSDTNHSFKIFRGEQLAKNLSDGEKSLIAFCYFIVQIEDILKNPQNQENVIIYIDDPISSLDNGHIFFIFSLIEEKILKDNQYHQVFISTHNLDFLKYLKRVTPKKIIDGQTTLNEHPNHYLIQRNQKQNDYCSLILKMPSYMSEYTTEFHFLFSELISFIKPLRRGSRQKIYENTYNTFYNIPNNLRKFLEYYLIQKFPNSCKDGALKNLNKIFTPDTSIKINRVINEYSHLTYIDRGWKPLEIPELENCVKEVMHAIFIQDEEYFCELLTLIGESTFYPDEVFEPVPG